MLLGIFAYKFLCGVCFYFSWIYTYGSWVVQFNTGVAIVDNGKDGPKLALSAFNLKLPLPQAPSRFHLRLLSGIEQSRGVIQGWKSIRNFPPIFFCGLRWIADVFWT